MADIERREQAVAWELRGLWTRKPRPRVVLTLSERCMIRRLEGVVQLVAVTGAFVVVDGWQIPTVEILAVSSPHFTQKPETPSDRLRGAFGPEIPAGEIGRA